MNLNSPPPFTPRGSYVNFVTTFLAFLESLHHLHHYNFYFYSFSPPWILLQHQHSKTKQDHLGFRTL